MDHIELVVHVAIPGECNAAIERAVELAKRLKARLSGVHAVSLPSATFAVPEAITLQVQEAEQARQAAIAQAGWWNQLLKVNGLTGDWRVGEGDVAQVLCLAVASADLLVVQRPETREDAPIGFGSTSRTVFAAGKPVLILPAAGADRVGQRMLVAWNGSLESTRALYGATPLLSQAEFVHVLDGSSDQSSEGLAWLPPLDPAAWCAQRNIKATFERFQPEGAPADAIVARARQLECDLIVLGAWGHSRLTEMVLGGVTRALFRDSPLPLLVAH